MTRFAKISQLTLVAALAAFVPSAQAQAPEAGAGASAAQGFTVQGFIAEVSLFLPPELLRPAGAGGGARGATAAPGAAGGSGAGGGAAAGSAGSGQNRPQLQFTRDPRLYLTSQQVDRLEPIAASLKANPMPSPSKARQIRAELASILTPAQKAEYADYQKAFSKFRAYMQKQRSGQGQQAPGSGNMTDQQRQDRAGQAGGGMSQLQRRQRIADAFLKALEEYRKQLG